MDTEQPFVRLQIGVLAWDGTALEMFRTDGRTGSFRLHGATIHRWEIEPHKKGPVLQVWFAPALREISILGPSDTDAVTAFMTRWFPSR